MATRGAVQDTKEVKANAPSTYKPRALGTLSKLKDFGCGFLEQSGETKARVLAEPTYQRDNRAEGKANGMVIPDYTTSSLMSFTDSGKYALVDVREFESWFLGSTNLNVDLVKLLKARIRGEYRTFMQRNQLHTVVSTLDYRSVCTVQLAPGMIDNDVVLDLDFVSRRGALNHDSPKSEWNDFFMYFGTHVQTEFVLGGRREERCSVTVRTEDSVRQLRLRMSARGGLKAAEGGAVAAIECNENGKMVKHEIAVNITVTGGDTKLQGDTEVKDWIASVESQPDVVGVNRMEIISNFFPISTRRLAAKKLQEFINEQLQEKPADVTTAKPVHLQCSHNGGLHTLSSTSKRRFWLSYYNSPVMEAGSQYQPLFIMHVDKDHKGDSRIDGRLQYGDRVAIALFNTRSDFLSSVPDKCAAFWNNRVLCPKSEWILENPELSQGVGERKVEVKQDQPRDYITTASKVRIVSAYGRETLKTALYLAPHFEEGLFYLTLMTRKCDWKLTNLVLD